ncbi:MAG TPA: SLC13 family permease, partial [Candidatus Thermoplasmatota archaeon]|nr:SLC13 family permease [Candidatus Thermoplasmatota archaeon]
RPAVALAGASLMILFSVVTPTQALEAIDLNTILLLVGMMLVVVTLESTGFFGHLALWIVEHSKNQRQLMVYLCVATAMLSALVLNDTVVLFFTPIIIHAARLLQVNPVKYLVVEAISANIGSVATEIGNPQNAYIGTVSGITFLRFLTIMGPTMLVALTLAVLILLVLYRNDLKAPIQPKAVTQLEEEQSISQPRLLWFSLAMTGLIFAAFLASHIIELPLSLIALAGGSILVFFAPVVGKSSPRVLFRRVDWSIILLFIGLFIVLQGVKVSGLLDQLFAGFERVSAGSIRTIWGLGLLASIISNLISNVPAVLLLSSVVADIATEATWFTLAAASTLAGNATILGAAANIIVAERSEEMGVGITFWEFTRVGLPITIATLAAAFAMVELLT